MSPRSSLRRMSAVTMHRIVFGFLSVLIGILASFIYGVAMSSAGRSGHGFLIDKHLAANLNCRDCHTESPPSKAPMMATCLGCHGGTYDKLGAISAEKLGITPRSGQPNPHASHQGPIPCGSCHHVHSASTMFCNSCHNFQMTTP